MAAHVINVDERPDLEAQIERPGAKSSKPATASRSTRFLGLPGEDFVNPKQAPFAYHIWRPKGDVTVEQKVGGIAKEVLTKDQTFSWVVAEMRTRTVNLRYSPRYRLPKEYSDAQKYIVNPLSFDPQKLSTAAAMELGVWWNKLRFNDRVNFATAYGLWCVGKRSR